MPRARRVAGQVHGVSPSWPARPTSIDSRAVARWTSGHKDGVGTAATARSRVWFTLTRGIVSEVFYPSVDRANTRRMCVVVAAGSERVFVDGSTRDYRARSVAPSVPAYHVRTRIPFDGLTLRKLVITDTDRAVLLQRTRLQGGEGSAHGARVFVLLEPHLDNNAATNDVWLGEYKGVPALLAQDSVTALALICSRPLTTGACAYVGPQDAVADILANGRLTGERASAMNGNVQLAAEIAIDESREFVLALGFGSSPDHAAQQARASLHDTFASAARRYVRGWRKEHERHDPCAVSRSRRVRSVFDVSIATIRVHQDKERTGAIIASLAVPWGFAHGDDRAGGYHLVWPRDLVESAEALLAVGRAGYARRTLAYLMSTQESDGMWPQNMWLDGTPHFRGIQHDEIALPILLARMLALDDGLRQLDAWPMVRAAAGYLVRAGPETPQDRWEDDAGYSPYSIATEVAALLAAAAFANEAGEAELAAYLCDTADDWAASLDRWTYVSGTGLAERHGVSGYYVRITPPAAVVDGGPAILGTPLSIPNQPCIDAQRPFEDVVSPDALALVRFGLRSAHDQRIRDTVKVIDAELRTATQRGPAWRRYTLDGYGEQRDGSANLVWGVGRPWPLLTGERAHYELARGRLDRAERLLQIMAAQANPAGLLPEQIWDAADIPSRQLFNGRPTGSATPLVWAHAEFLKLCRSIRDGRVFDLPLDAARRYANDAPRSNRVTWRPNRRIDRVPHGSTLRVESADAQSVEWRLASAERHGHLHAIDVGIGINHADLATTDFSPGDVVHFRMCANAGGADEREHTVRISARGE